MLERAELYQASEPEAPASGNMLLGDHGRCREEDDRVPQRVQNQADRDRKHRERTADDRQTPLLACHFLPFCSRMMQSKNRRTAFGVIPAHPSSPRFLRPSLRSLNRSASLATAWRASALAPFALSRSPITI